MARYDETCHQWHLYSGDECYALVVERDLLISVRLLAVTRYAVTFKALAKDLWGRRDTPEAEFISSLGTMPLVITRSFKGIRFGATQSVVTLRDGRRILPPHKSALILDSVSVPA